nr:class I SAM-dependent methyltransferase [Spirochaetaceae bacterium]
EHPFPMEKNEKSRYTFDNSFFTAHDVILLYSLLRHIKPKQVIEVGSGFSSAAMLDTREKFPEIGTQFTFIEPFPERLYSLLKEDDKEHCTILEEYLQDVDINIFQQLQPGDMIFIDSGHQLKTGSEVVYLLFEILPRLTPGVLIHFHDIFWPFEYPQEWIDVGRCWNETYALRAFLQNNSKYEIFYFSSYMGNVHKKEVNSLMPFGDGIPEEDLPGGNFYGGGSLWIEKKG